jgi:FG-GAP-like repeat
MLDANGDGIVDLAVPGAERRTLRIVTFAGGQFRELQRIGHSAAIRSAVIAADVDGDGRKELVYALADDLLVVLTAPR